MHRLIASWFGTGLILGRVRGSDVGSGTVGAFFAALLAVAIGAWLGWAGQIAAAAVATVLSIWSAGVFVDQEGDAGWIVIDEAAGTFVALTGLATAPAIVVGFLAFRAADIFKNFFPGVARAERLPGGAGITADDLVAGLYGLAAGQIVQTFI